MLRNCYTIAACVPGINLPLECKQNAGQAHDQNHQPRQAADCEMKPEKTSAQALHASNLGPLAKEIVLYAGELDGAWMVGHVAVQPLNCHIEIEEQGPLCIVADHALNPEKRCGASAARDRPHVMQAGRR